MDLNQENWHPNIRPVELTILDCCVIMHPIMGTREHITHEAGNDEAWICICANTPSSGGFYPCDAEGNEMEPMIGSSWSGLYVCADCGAIIDLKTLDIV